MTLDANANTPPPARPALPPEAFADTKIPRRYPGRQNPRRKDLAATVVFTVALIALVVLYVVDAAQRGNSLGSLGQRSDARLATTLAVVAPPVLALFSAAFSTLFVLRRVPASWLPIVAGVLVVALYSVTQGMLDTVVLDRLR